MTERKTYQTRLLSSLQNGVDFTAKQISSRFNTSIDGAYTLVYRLRNKGHDVKLKELVTKSGDTLYVYSMPKRRSRKRAA
jgi:hypothetical protein